MTGGQEVTGLMDVPSMTRALEAEGVRRIVVCAEDPKRYGRRARWARGRRGARPRPAARGAGASCATVPGVTVIIYDQRCAAEARRLRKRGQLDRAAPPGGHQRGGVRGLRRLQHQEQLPVGAAPRHRVRREAPDPRPVLQPRLHLPRRRLPVVRHPHAQPARRPAPSTAGADDRATPARPRCRRASLPDARRCRPSTGSTASTSPGSAAPAWSPPTGSSPPRPKRPGCVVGGHGPDRPLAEGRCGGLAPAPRRATAPRSARPRSAPAGPTSTCPATSCRPPAPTHLDKVRPGSHHRGGRHASFTPTAAMLQTDVAAARPGGAPSSAIAEQVGADRVVVRRLASASPRRVFANHLLANVVLLGAAFQRGRPAAVAGRHRRRPSARQGRPADDNREAFEWGRWVVARPRRGRGAPRRGAPSDDAAGGSIFDPSPEARQPRPRRSWSTPRRCPTALRDLLVRRTAQVDRLPERGAGRALPRPGRAVGRAPTTPAHGWALTRAVAESWFKLLTYKDEYEVARLHLKVDYDAVARDLGIEGAVLGDATTCTRRSCGGMGMKRKLPMGKPYDVGFRALAADEAAAGHAVRPVRLRPRPAHRARRDRGVRAARPATSVADARPRLRHAGPPRRIRGAIKGYAEIKERAVEQWRAEVRATPRRGLRSEPAG